MRDPLHQWHWPGRARFECRREWVGPVVKPDPLIALAAAARDDVEQVGVVGEVPR
jgi:hypothetical protein